MTLTKKILPIGLVALAVMLSLGTPHLSYAGDENSEWSAGSLWNGPFFNGPNQGFQISVQTPNGIPQHSTQSAKITGTINLVGVKFNLDDQDDDSHGYKHGLTLLERLVSKGYRVQAYWPDLTTQVNPDQVSLSSSDGKTIQFRFDTPALQSSDLNLFTLQVMLPSNGLANMQKVQAKFDRRIVAINALIAKLSAKAKTDAKDITSLKRIRDKLLAASAGMGGWLAQRPDVLAEARFPLQLDNKVATSSLNSTIMGKFRLQIAYDLGSAIEGEKTTVHGKVTNLKVPDWDDFFGMDLNPSEKTDQGESPHRWVTRFYWGSSLLKEFSAQTIAEGQSVLFDFDTDKLEPEDSNTFMIKHYSWHDKMDRTGSLGSVFAHLSLKLPVANDNTAPTVLAGATPDAPHSCVYDMQPVNISLLDAFGLIDPTTIQASLRGALNNGALVGGDVTGRVSAVSPDQGQNYLLTDSGTLNPSSEGVYTFSTKSQDLAGNFTLPNPYSATFRVNRTPPLITLGAQSGNLDNGVYYTNQAFYSFNVSVTDFFDLCTVFTSVTRNSIEVQTDGTPAFVAGLTLDDGLNLLAVSSTNQAGNSSSVSLVPVVLDTAPPVLSQLSPVNGSVVTLLNFPVSGKSDEILSSIQLNGKALTLAADRKSFSGFYEGQTEGPLSLQWVATDLAGNVTTQNAQIQILLRALNADLLSVVPDPDGVHLLIKGAPGSTRPGLTVNADAGLFSRSSAVGATNGSFTIRMFAFRQATVSAYDPSINRSDSAVVNYGNGSDTILSGVVKDTSDNLLPGVTIRIAGTSLIALTDASGVFKFSQPVLGDQKIIVDGTTIPASFTGPNKKFSALSIVVNIGLSQSNVLQRPIYLAPLIMDTAKIVDGTMDATVTDVNAPGVQLEIPAGTATFPNGGSSGAVSMAVNSADHSTVPPLAFAQPKNVISLEPSGTKFSRPITLTLNNDNHLPPGVELVILSLNSERGTWEIDGAAKVSTDGSKVITKPGQGVTHFSTIYASPIAPTIRPIGGQEVQGADAFNGALTKSIHLPSFKSLGGSVSPSLIYKSSWAKPTTLVSNLVDIPRREIPLDYTFSGTQPIKYCSIAECKDDQEDYYVSVQYASTLKGTSWYEPNSISSQFTAAGISSEKYEFVGVPNQSTVSYAVEMKNLEENGDYVSSGIYPYVAHYDINLDQITVGTQSQRSWSNVFAPQVSSVNVNERHKLDQAFPQDLTGPLFVQNEVHSPIGRGWKIAGVQRIVNPADSKVMLEEEDGSISTYALNNTIDTLYDANGAQEDLSQGSDVSSWPHAFMFRPSGARVVRKNLSDASSVADLGGMYGVGGTLRGFLYVDVDPDRSSNDNFSSCYRLYQDYNIPSRPQQFTLLADGTLVGTDHNRHTLFGVSSGGTALFAGRYYGPPSSYSFYSDRIMCKIHDGICRQNNADNGAAIDPVGLHAAMRGSMSSGCQGLPNASCSGQVADDYNAVGFGGCGPGVSSSGNFASGSASPGDSSMNSPLNAPMGITAGLKSNTVVVADYSNNRVMIYDRGTGTSKVLAGNISSSDTGDGGLAVNAGIYHPRGVAYDSVGNLYISNDNGLIRKVDPSGLISTLAGGGAIVDNAPALKMGFRTPTGLVVDNQNGYLYVADSGNHRVVRVDLQTKLASVVAGNSSCIGDSSDLAVGEGSAALNASLCNPTNLGLDADSNLLIVDSGHQRIRRVVFQSSNVGVLAFAPVRKDFSVMSRNSDGTWKRTYRNGHVMFFGVDGKISRQLDRAGRSTAFTYDPSSGLLTAVTDPTGRSIVYAYSNGYLTSITDPAGRVTRFNIIGGNLSSVVYPDGSQQSFGVNAVGLISSETDQRGKSTQYVYNEWNRLKTVIHPDLSQESVSDSGSATVAATSGSESQSNALKGYGLGSNQVHDSVTDASGQQTSFVKAYDGRVASVVDPQGKQLDVTRDKLGRTTKATRSDGTYISYVYESVYGDLISQYDSYTGISTSQEFNTYGSLTKKTNGRGFTVSTTYNADGQMIGKTDPLLNTTTFAYSGPYKLMSAQTDSLNRTTLSEYDGAGNVVKITAPGGLVRVFTLDPSGSGNALAVINPKGQKTQFTFDPMNRLTAVVTPKGERIEYSYLPTGQLSQVKDPLGNITAQEYDDLGRLTKVIDSSGFPTAFSYNERGNVSLVVDPNGNQKQYLYDSQNRLVKTILPDNILTTAYNDRGDVIQRADLRSQIDYNYDTVSRLMSVDTHGLGALSDLPEGHLGFEYDENGNRKSLTDSFGKTTYIRDANDRLTLLTNPKGESFSYNFDNSSGETILARLGTSGATPITTQATLDPSGFLMSVTHAVNGATINSFSYQRDVLGSPTQITTGQGLRSIAYEDNGQVVSASNSEVSATDPTKMGAETFDYDSIYNRKIDQNGSYVYDSKSQRLTQDYRYFYFYDNNGNLRSKQAIGLTGEVTNYFYSSENLLLGFKVYAPASYDPTQLFLVSGTQPVREVFYDYDVEGRRVQKRVIDHDSTAISDVTKNFVRRYIYDGGELLAEYDGGNNPLLRYTHSTIGTDDVIAIDVKQGGVNQKIAQTAGTYYYLKDAMGSIIDVINGSGERLQHYVYSAFGQILGVQDAFGADITSNPVLATSLTFTGREWDKESGFYYFRARYYDPSTGRFLQKDPQPGALETPASVVNSYAYVANNPTSMRDPSGMSWWTTIRDTIVHTLALPGLLFILPLAAVLNPSWAAANIMRTFNLSLLGNIINVLVTSNHHWATASTFNGRDTLENSMFALGVGLTPGPVSFLPPNATNRLRYHEIGHQLQYEKYGGYEYIGRALGSVWHEQILGDITTHDTSFECEAGQLAHETFGLTYYPDGGRVPGLGYDYSCGRTQKE